MLEVGKIYRWSLLSMDPEDKLYIAKLTGLRVNPNDGPVAVAIEDEWHPWHQIRSFSLHNDQEAAT